MNQAQKNVNENSFTDSEGALIEVQSGPLTESNSLTVNEVEHQVELIQKLMRSVMKNDEHYGIIPGCKKPSLYKPGAEKLIHIFRLAPEYEELPGSREDDGFILYKIRCNLTHVVSGRFLGSGMGACNSREKKYRETSVWEEKGGKKVRTKVPQDPWDIQNTLYKMACKRALIAATLNVTAASDIFTQDIEDIGGETHRDNGVQGAAKKPPQRNSASSQECITENQAKRFYAIYKGAGITDEGAKTYLHKNYGIDESRNIKKSDYDAICDWALNGGQS